MGVKRRTWYTLAKIGDHFCITSPERSASNIILNYHSILSGNSDRFGNIAPSRFRRDLQYLTENYNVVPLSDILEGLHSKERNIAITFDDAYSDFYVNARPLLQEFHAPATVFVNPNFIGDKNLNDIISSYGLHEVERPVTMNESQIQELVDSDLYSIGNHTKNHPDLTELKSEKSLRDEIIKSQTLLESKFGVKINHFAYPYGRYDEKSLQIVRETHDLALAGKLYLHDGQRHIDLSGDQFILPRVSAHVPQHFLRWEMSGTSELIRKYHHVLFERN